MARYAAWSSRGGDGTYVHDKQGRRTFLVRGGADLLTCVNGVTARAGAGRGTGHVGDAELDGDRRALLRSRIGEVVGDGMIGDACAKVLGNGPGGHGDVVLAVLPGFRPVTIERLLRNAAVVLPVFPYQHMVMVGPLLSGAHCPCVRCLYGRLAANAPHADAFHSLCAAAEQGEFLGLDPMERLGERQRAALAAAILVEAADLLSGTDVLDRGPRQMVSIDLGDGSRKRHQLAPLPGDVNDHAWKEGLPC